MFNLAKNECLFQNVQNENFTEITCVPLLYIFVLELVLFDTCLTQGLPDDLFR